LGLREATKTWLPGQPVAVELLDDFRHFFKSLPCRCPPSTGRCSTAVDFERWAITRSKGVINLFKWVGEGMRNRVDEKIQIILRLYESPAEVLYGFDCDSYCCAYDGKGVWVSPRWLFAIHHSVNVLNPLHSYPNKP
jgi:hypothetical protein